MPNDVRNQPSDMILDDIPGVREQNLMLDYTTLGDWIPQMMQTLFSPEQLVNAKSHTTNILNSFHERGLPETLNPPLSDHAAIELQMTRMHGLVMKAAKNLPSFYLLLPQEDQELRQVAFIVNRWMQQRTILAGTIEQKRFIIGVNHLTVWQGHLTRFLRHVITAARPGSHTTNRAASPFGENMTPQALLLYPTASTSRQMQGWKDAEVLLKMSYDDLGRLGWEEAKIQNFEMNRSRIVEVVAIKKIEQHEYVRKQQQQRVAVMINSPAMTITRPPSQATDRVRPPLSAQQDQTSSQCLPQIIRHMFTQEEIENATLHTRNIMNAFSRRAPETLNVLPSHDFAIEQRMHMMHGLALQAAHNLPSFYLLLPQEEQELKQVIFILSQIIQQRTILAQNPGHKRFIFGIEHLNMWQGHLTAFLVRIKNVLALPDSLGSIPPTRSQASMQQHWALQERQFQTLQQQRLQALQQQQSQSQHSIPQLREIQQQQVQFLGSPSQTPHQAGPSMRLPL
ncbi:hypothetical protein FRB95_000576 [Tulasnella sp. JGI-2019a]|nr:hypothetical protein FRB95_000576 [Tulasnella sp. JGI-2019a]